jgi:chorismate mutase
MNGRRDTAKPKVCRGIRGATTTPANQREAILSATRDLLQQIVEANDVTPTDIASIFFTMTPDLDAEYPALAARQMGWTNVPLLCAQEIARTGGLPQAIRVLIHWNTTLSQTEIHHIYINGAEVLRPDFASSSIQEDKA